ncbi:MAG: O-antigen chain-terminating methyltransferase [Parcubacteria group bacterium]|nr:O-antigen chain-terminating methyltransferase [Parcubacteria group bacterium]
MNKKILKLKSEIVSVIKKALIFIRRVLDKSIFRLNILDTYYKQDECERYKDCVLLHKIIRSQPPASDRYIEYPWMLENIKITSGKILDIGSTICDRLFATLPKTIEVHGINLNKKLIKNNEIKFKTGDIRKTDYQSEYFDCVVCISTLEHIGVSGRYSSDEDPKGDIRAMEEINRIMKKGGTLLVTLPYGIKDVLPINKLYNEERVKNLFRGFEIISQDFYKFSPLWKVWIKTTEKEAGKTDMIKDQWYALSLIKAIKK